MRYHEEEEQIKLFQLANYQRGQYPEIEMLFAIPNGGYRTKAEASLFKAQGVKAGVPDVFLAYPSGNYAGLFIEMKHGKNKSTPIQEDWQRRLQFAGYQVKVCYGAEEAMHEIIQYLKEYRGHEK